MSARPDERGEHVLVVVMDEDPDLSALRRTLGGVPDAHVRLVAPRHVGPLDWFATDEARTHDAAEARAGEGARALEPVVDVEAAEAGELDPVLAVEDALNESRADRMVVLGDADPALERTDGSATPREAGRAIMSGRSRLTPYAMIVGAALFLLAVAVVVYVLAAIII